MNLIRYLLSCGLAVFLLVPWYSLGMMVGLVNATCGSRIITSWNRFFLKLFHIEVSIEREDAGEVPLNGCVFVLLNQTSLIETPIVSVHLPYHRVIANIEYALIPFYGWIMWVFGWVIVRQRPQQARKTMEKVTPFLRRGENIWISIEGRRSQDGSLSPYKKGPVVLAMQAQARIVPFFIHGARDCLPYGEWRIRPGKVTVKFFKAISTEGMEYAHRDLLVSRLRSIAEREMHSQR